MTIIHATQIANLINERNQLVKQYSAKDILAHPKDFEFDVIDNKVAACVEVKKVQWYQWEICHLSVHSDFERKGLGTQMIQRAEAKAIQSGAKVIQCTIREDNTPSTKVFTNQGFKIVSMFFYPTTGNNVTVWQKVVSPPPELMPRSSQFMT